LQNVTKYLIYFYQVYSNSYLILLIENDVLVSLLTDSHARHVRKVRAGVTMMLVKYLMKNWGGGGKNNDVTLIINVNAHVKLVGGVTGILQF